MARAHRLCALALLLAFGLGLGVACDRGRSPEPEAVPPSSPAPAPAPAASLSPRLRRPAADRVVAIGDVHGDLDHFERALRLAGAVDDRGRWIGGSLVVVQTGDEIDRGNDDRAVLDSVEELKKQAAAAGGEVIALLGNHEIMNASADFRYVTPRGFAAFSPAAMSSLPAADTAAPTRGRMLAFAPGGQYGTMLAGRPLVAEVGDTVFVHGGVLPKHVAYGLDRMNDELDAWLAGKRSTPPAIVVADDGPVWTRAYSDEGTAPDCAA
ncbi:MAG TPA: metallophosphoesterase, partial [Polyangiaceae bacterium]